MQFPADIEAERKQNGLFTSFSDFIVRMSAYDMNRRTMDSLIKCGVFDSLYPNRRALVMSYERMMDYAAQDAGLSGIGQMSFFEGDDKLVNDSMIITGMPDYTLEEKLSFEKELAGMYLSSHPLDSYRAQVKAFSETDIFTIIENSSDRQYVKLCGVLSNIRKRRTKNGKLIVETSLGDFDGEIELVAFENTYLKYSQFITDGSAVYCEATVNSGNENSISLVLSKLYPMDMIKIPPSKKMYVKIPDMSYAEKVTAMTSSYPGENELYIYDEKTKTVFKGDISKKINICNELIGDLTAEFGDENIKVK